MLNRKLTVQKQDDSFSQNSLKQRNFTITKRIAKHGSQAIICIPNVLKDKLKPGMIVQINLEIVEK